MIEELSLLCWKFDSSTKFLSFTATFSRNSGENGVKGELILVKLQVHITPIQLLIVLRIIYGLYGKFKAISLNIWIQTGLSSSIVQSFIAKLLFLISQKDNRIE